MAVRPEEVAKSDEQSVDEVEKEIDLYLQERKGKIEQRIDVPIPSKLTQQQRTELVKRYKKAGWNARIHEYEADIHDPREQDWTALVLEVR
jgi:ribosome recycling factor